MAGADKYSTIYGNNGVHYLTGEFLSWKQVSETQVVRSLRNSLDDNLGQIN
jgi:RNase P/RNase MRP subunit POP5